MRGFGLADGAATAAMLGSALRSLWSVGARNAAMLALLLSRYSGLLGGSAGQERPDPANSSPSGTLRVAFLTRFDSIPDRLFLYSAFLGLAAFLGAEPASGPGRRWRRVLGPAPVGFAHATYGDILSVGLASLAPMRPMGLSVTPPEISTRTVSRSMPVLHRPRPAAGVQRALRPVVPAPALFFRLSAVARRGT